jgi:hypothetical protein
VDDFGTDEEIDTLIDQVAELWSEISQERRKSPPKRFHSFLHTSAARTP